MTGPTSGEGHRTGLLAVGSDGEAAVSLLTITINTWNHIAIAARYLVAP